MRLTNMQFKQLAGPSTAGWIVVLGVALGPSGCGDNSYTIEYADSGATILGDASTQTVSAPIGATGGTVTGADGSSISIPAGALSGTQTISITPSPSTAAPAGITAAGTPEVLGPEGLQFASPVTLTLDVDTTKLPVGKTIQDVEVFTAPVGSTNFTQLTATVVDANHVSAQTTHFSVFIPGIGTLADASTTSTGDDGGDDDGGTISIVDAGPAPDATTTSSDGGGAVATDGGSAPISDAGSTTAFRVLATGQKSVTSIALNGGKLYWGNAGNSSIESYDLATNGGPTTFAAGQPSPHDLTSDGTNLYWVSSVLPADAGAEAGAGPSGPSTIEEQAFAGGAATTLQTLQSGVGVAGLAVYGANAYVTAYSAATGNAVYSVPTGGAEIMSLSAPSTNAITFNAQDTAALVATSTTLYAIGEPMKTFGTYSSDTLYTIPTTGDVADASAPLTAMPGAGRPLAVTTDGTTLFWTSSGDTSNNQGQILSVPIAGGTPTVLATYTNSNLDLPGICADAGAGTGDGGGSNCTGGGFTTNGNYAYGIAVDGTNVYFTTNGGTVSSVPKTGGPVTTLYSALTLATAGYWAITVDDSNVYWTSSTGSNDSVYSIGK